MALLHIDLFFLLLHMLDELCRIHPVLFAQRDVTHCDTHFFLSNQTLVLMHAASEWSSFVTCASQLSSLGRLWSSDPHRRHCEPRRRSVCTTTIVTAVAIAVALLITSSDAATTTELYRIRTNRSVWGTPQFVFSSSINSHLLLFGSYDRSVQAVRAETGVRVWQALSENSVRADLAVSQTSHVVVDVTLSGRITCRDLATGAIQWTHQRTSFTWVFSPVVYGGLVFVPSRNDDVVVLSLDKGVELRTIPGTSGVWSAPLILPPKKEHDPKLLFSGSLIIAITAGAVVESHPFSSTNGTKEGIQFAQRDTTAALQAAGGTSWRHDLVPGATHYKQRQHAWIFGSPVRVVSRSGAEDAASIVFGANDRTVRAISAANGSGIWVSRVRGKVSSTPVVAVGPDNVAEYPVVLLETGDVICFGNDGTPRWQASLRQSAAASVSPSVLANMVVAGGTRGDVYGWDGATGDERFHVRLDGCSVRSAPGLQLLSKGNNHGDRLLVAVGCDNGQVAVFAVDGLPLRPAVATAARSSRRSASRGGAASIGGDERRFDSMAVTEVIRHAVSGGASYTNGDMVVPPPSSVPLLILAFLSSGAAAAFYIRRSSLKRSVKGMERGQ